MTRSPIELLWTAKNMLMDGFCHNDNRGDHVDENGFDEMTMAKLATRG